MTSGRRGLAGPGDPATRRQPRRALVLAAFFAAARRLAGPLVRAAFFADADRACRASAWGDAALRPSRLSRFSIARERRNEVFFLPLLLAFRVSRAAARRVSSEVVPFLGGFSFTPARRAFDSPGHPFDAGWEGAAARITARTGKG